MRDFQDYFSSKVTISRFPNLQDLQAGMFDDCKYRINVSDIYHPEIDNAFKDMGVENFWFPLGEAFGMALESLYGALRIMWKAEKQEQSLLLHCHAGNNRSVMAADSYYFLRTQKQRKQSQTGLQYAKNKRNQLLLNIDDGQLPGIYKMEEFLQCCRESFDSAFSDGDRPLDWIKHQMHMTGSGFCSTPERTEDWHRDASRNTTNKRGHND